MTTSKLIYGLAMFVWLGVIGAIPIVLTVGNEFPWILIGVWSLTWLTLILRWIPKIVESGHGND